MGPKAQSSVPGLIQTASVSATLVNVLQRQAVCNASKVTLELLNHDLPCADALYGLLLFTWPNVSRWSGWTLDEVREGLQMRCTTSGTDQSTQSTASRLGLSRLTVRVLLGSVINELSSSKVLSVHPKEWRDHWTILVPAGRNADPAELKGVGPSSLSKHLTLSFH